MDSKSLLRLIAFKYRNKSSTPVALKAVCKTFEDLLPDQDFNLVECLKEVRSYRIVVGTYSSIGKLIEVTALENIFTHAVVDEAGQCTEMGVLIPMVLVGKTGQTIMAGDPMQMPPFVVCGHASDRGLAVSMISRLLDCYSNLQNVVNQTLNTDDLFGLNFNRVLFSISVCGRITVGIPFAVQLSCFAIYFELLQQTILRFQANCHH